MTDNRANGALAADHPLYAPGLKRRPRVGGKDAAYWIPPARLIKAGWATKAVSLAADLTEEEIAAECRRLWAELTAWRTGQPVKTRYTISWLINRYQTDDVSPYRAIKRRTRVGYDASCKIIDETVGSFLIDAYMEGGMLRPRIFGRDLREWHRGWGQPDAHGIVTTPVRAWHAFGMLRILLSYNAELGTPGADNLRELAGNIRVPSPSAREAAPERVMVLAHVARAVELGLLSMAITTLAQFEFTERRTHIIGVWEGKQWRPGWLWTGISKSWQITYHQTKVGKVERAFDLTATPALLDMLQRIPEENRIGPVIVCERTGKPWKERHYARVFRAIAREIGIPDDIWSMDMRAGGATEAGNLAGITTMDLQAAGGWKDPKMVGRYTRDRKNRAQKVIQLRQAAASKREE